MSKNAQHEHPNKPLKVWKTGEAQVVQQKTYKRFTLKQVFNDLLDILLLNKGLFFTAKELFIRPGRVIRAMLDTDRDRYSHPLKFFVLIAGVYLYIVLNSSLFEMKPQDLGSDFNAEHTDVVLSIYRDYFLNYLNVWIAFGMLFYAFFTHRLFKTSGYNYTEHLVANLYISAQLTLLYSPLILLHNVIPDYIRNSMEVLWMFGFSIWVFKDWLKRSFWATVWRSSLAIALGSISLILLYSLVFFTAGVIMGITEASNA